MGTFLYIFSQVEIVAQHIYVTNPGKEALRTIGYMGICGSKEYSLQLLTLLAVSKRKWGPLIFSWCFVRYNPKWLAKFASHIFWSFWSNIEYSLYIIVSNWAYLLEGTTFLPLSIVIDKNPLQCLFRMPLTSIWSGLGNNQVWNKVLTEGSGLDNDRILAVRS